MQRRKACSEWDQKLSRGGLEDYYFCRKVLERAAGKLIKVTNEAGRKWKVWRRKGYDRRGTHVSRVSCKPEHICRTSQKIRKPVMMKKSRKKKLYIYTLWPLRTFFQQKNPCPCRCQKRYEHGRKRAWMEKKTAPGRNVETKAETMM